MHNSQAPGPPRVVKMEIDTTNPTDSHKPAPRKRMSMISPTSAGMSFLDVQDKTFERAEHVDRFFSEATGGSRRVYFSRKEIHKGK